MVVKKELIVEGGFSFIRRSDMRVPVMPEMDAVLDEMIKNETGEYPQVREIVRGNHPHMMRPYYPEEV